MRSWVWCGGVALSIVTLQLAGCATGRPLMPTPNVYVGPAGNYFDDVQSALQTPDVDLLFVTDRVPEKNDKGELRYGYGRSNSMAFGRAVVALGDDITWAALVTDSQKSARARRLDLSLHSVEELGRFPETPAPFDVEDQAFIFDPDYLVEEENMARRLQQEVARRLALAPRKEVLVFVHGYHNTFDDAVYAMAEMWHFLGRFGVAVVYSWPAGYPGLFGYTYDRESSEFTVLHLKQTLRAISAMPEVKGIHLIAHSRGTDVAMTSVRELFIEARGAGVHPLERYKLKNVILAAPDLDIQVVEQRIAGEQLLYGVEHATMYFSPADEAIGIAQMLFASPRGRLGRLERSRMDADLLEGVRERRQDLSMVRFEGGPSDQYGHSYFRTNPAVSSDLVLMLRYELPPGTPERPLQSLGGGFWKIPPGYPNATK